MEASFTASLRGHSRQLIVFLSVCGVGVLMSMGGCAANPESGAGAPKADIVTESDEPDARRRARIRLELAIGYFEQGQTTVALDELKQSISADPNFAPAYNLRGLIYMRLNDPGLAEDSFRRALVLNPRDADVFHNYGWLLCQQSRFGDSYKAFAQAIAVPLYGGRAKSWMAQGLCQMKAGQAGEAELSFQRSYELDAGNPVTGYNLARLLFQRGDLVRSQFYVRRLNNSDLANSESLWLGIKVERKLDNREAVQQLAGQLKKRFAQSRELASFERSAFDE